MRDAQGRIPYNDIRYQAAKYPCGRTLCAPYNGYPIPLPRDTPYNTIRAHPRIYCVGVIFLNVNGNEMATGATAIALILAAQFDDVLELELFVTLLLQVAYAMEIVALQRKRVEKLEGKKECPDDFYGPI